MEIEPFDQSNEIGSLKVNGKAAIIDGQHRIGGIVSHHEDTGDVVSFDFICFENLTLEEEKKSLSLLMENKLGCLDLFKHILALMKMKMA